MLTDQRSSGSPRWEIRPYALVSLWEMINFGLGSFCALLDWLLWEEMNTKLRRTAPPPQPPTNALLGSLFMASADPNLSDDDVKRARDLLEFANLYVDPLELTATGKRIKRFLGKLEVSMSYSSYEAEIRALRETLEDELRDKWFYYYPRDKAALVKRIEKEWPKSYERFPSAKAEIAEAVDCYATGHNTASVFHFMRVAEYGLRALARERNVKLPNKPIEWGTWGAILDEIEKNVKQIENRRAGPARAKALEFYRGVLGEFSAFKDVYRDNVMHARKRYDEGRARSVMVHVCEFMERLAEKIEEKPKAIRWGLK